jgi:hypothetical protein
MEKVAIKAKPCEELQAKITLNSPVVVGKRGGFF